MNRNGEQNRDYNETLAYQNYMNEIEDMVLVKDKQSDVANNYRSAAVDDFRSGEKSVS
jgi:hypothetical protein